MKKYDNEVNENASERPTYVKDIYNFGASVFKRKALENMNQKWAKMHTDGEIHIHDFEAYGKTYNCLGLNWINLFKNKRYDHLSMQGKLIKLFFHLNHMISNVGNQQSGGMGFINFDTEMAYILTQFKFDLNSEIQVQLFNDLMVSFVEWCNNCHLRGGGISFYTTFNIGLETSKLGKLVANSLLSAFSSDVRFFKPNIVFKVKRGVNFNDDDPNYDIFQKALEVTGHKMIPTYLLCDSKQNANLVHENFGIMGCRTRVADDIYGDAKSIGRGNIANITINLPRIGLEILASFNDISDEEKHLMLNQILIDKMDIVKDILLDRYAKTVKIDERNISYVLENKLWDNAKDFSSLDDIFKHGTLSIGFIGLYDLWLILFNKRFYDGEELNKALNLVMLMRNKCDEYSKIYQLNFSLLGTAAESVSGTFPKKDKSFFSVKNYQPEFYTNSFHVVVNSMMPWSQKIETEAKFHELCNGGSMTYIEKKEAPGNNILSIKQMIEYSITRNVNYLGINFPLDICNACNASGILPLKCHSCGSVNIIRLRRVSGYIEELSRFAEGKRKEALERKSN